jgi:hypothetical protein
VDVLQGKVIQGTGVDVLTSLNLQPPTETVTQAVKRTDDQDSSLDPYQPKGFNMGPFTILPRVTVATYFDDNVFALPFHTLGDWAFVVRPQVTIRSNGWNNTDVVANAFVMARANPRACARRDLNAGMSI